MPDSGITKRALSNALKELMKDKSFVSISVSEICDRCDMNRKSFYYHFKDKYDLVNWIFDTEVFDVIQSMPLNEEETGLDGKFAYFVRLMHFFYDNRSFYKKAFLIEGQNSFCEHFRELCYPVFANKVRRMYDNENNTDFQADFYADAIIYSIKRWITDSAPMSPEEYSKNLFECIIKPAIYIANEVAKVNKQC